MRPILLLILLIICALNVFSQETDVDEEFYESGNIRLRYYIIQEQRTANNTVYFYTYWHDNGNKLSEEISSTQKGFSRYINCWTADNQQICISGNGRFYWKRTHDGFEDDSIIYIVKDSVLQGKFICYSDYGKGRIKSEEGTYINGLRQGAVTF